MFRNKDLESSSELALLDSDFKKYSYPLISELRLQILCMFIFSFILLPTPHFITNFLTTQFKLVEVPEGIGEDEELEYEFGVQNN